jgi:hypothetical protein
LEPPNKYRLKNGDDSSVVEENVPMNLGSIPGKIYGFSCG